MHRREMPGKVWGVAPPLIENTIKVYTVKNGSNQIVEKDFAFGIFARARFDLSCGHSGNPQMELLISQDQYELDNPPSEKLIILKLDKDKGNRTHDFESIPGVTGLVGLKEPKITVDYEAEYLFFEKGVIEKPTDEHGERDFNLISTLIFDWGGKRPQQGSKGELIDWDNYGLKIVKTMKVYNVINEKHFLALSMKTDALFEKLSDPIINLEVRDNTGDKVEPNIVATEDPAHNQYNHYHVKRGEYYSGLECKIDVNNITGCVYFSDPPLGIAQLIKAKREVDPDSEHFQLTRCRIFDWKGLPLP
ncbi:MAG TPA: hypothetical protein VHY08_17555 [Bacillota bacterium]|nr:hypothetical protein [Bacillota bacterium]